ncbi:MAG: EAL domain-containing protein [Luteimonas sp.]
MAASAKLSAPAASASRSAGTSIKGTAASARAEYPPAYYWRRWCADAAAAMFATDDVASAPVEPPLPQVLPPGEREAPYRVLIVEDDRSQALFAESVLNGTGMQARVVSVPGEAMAAMQAFAPDLVLIDLHMPGISGTELTAMIRANAAFAHTPIVFLTGDDDPERQFEALQVGADDFLSKPVRPRHLVAAIESRARRARMLQRQRSSEGRHPVTGLHTRTAMLQRLGAAIPGDNRGAVYFIEIESTAALRERYGYAALEATLTEAARRLGMIAGDHPLSRLNDNTFLAFAPTLERAQLQDCARGLRDGLSRHVLQINGESLRLRALIGYASLQHGYSDDGSAIAAAEQALRAARSTSGGIAAAQPPTPPRNDSRFVDLHDAILHDRFELAYQPIVAVAGGGEAQYQTLLRLRDAEGTLRTAAEILPMAEAAGVVHEIDHRVLQLAIATLVARRGAVRLFVSQSPRSLIHDGYADDLLDRLRADAIDPALLVVDVRQDEALIHALPLQKFCAAMVPAGVQLCLSEYQAGKDADALLARLPLSFVRLAAGYSSHLDDVAQRDEMRAAIERAHRLGLQTIGQQVEDPQAAATLWINGVDYIQGNLVQHAADGLDFDFRQPVL